MIFDECLCPYNYHHNQSVKNTFISPKTSRCLSEVYLTLLWSYSRIFYSCNPTVCTLLPHNLKTYVKPKTPGRLSHIQESCRTNKALLL